MSSSLSLINPGVDYFLLQDFTIMNKKILNIATQKLNKLQAKYPNFINIIVDDWRGYRFIYDTDDVRNCQNKCGQCNLFQLLKNEKDGQFSSGLYLASLEDKKIFGPQNYLNCKTLKQYQRCYLSFLEINKTNFQEIKKEINLIKNCRLIFSKNDSLIKKEVRFKKALLKRASQILQSEAWIKKF